MLYPLDHLNFDEHQPAAKCGIPIIFGEIRDVFLSHPRVNCVGQPARVKSCARRTNLPVYMVPVG